MIDFNTRRLYWVDRADDTIRSSNLDGTNVTTLYESSGEPYGLAVLGERVYWGHSSSGTIKSGSINVEEGAERIEFARIEHTENSSTAHFTVPIKWNPPGNRKIHVNLHLGYTNLRPYQMQETRRIHYSAFYLRSSVLRVDHFHKIVHLPSI